jgi:hypothetical protein
MPKLLVFVLETIFFKRVNANDIFVGRGKEEIPESLSVIIFSILLSVFEHRPNWEVNYEH